MRAARVAPRVAGLRGVGGAGGPGSRRGRQGPQSGQDLGEQGVSGWYPKVEAAGMVDQPAGDGDQQSSQGFGHGIAVAFALPGRVAATGGDGELVYPAGDPDSE